MTDQTQMGLTGRSRFIELFQQQSLISRAELVLHAGINRQGHWTYTILVWGIKTLTWPLEHKAIAVAIVALLMFAPLF